MKPDLSGYNQLQPVYGRVMAALGDHYVTSCEHNFNKLPAAWINMQLVLKMAGGQVLANSQCWRTNKFVLIFLCLIKSKTSFGWRQMHYCSVISQY